MDSFDARARAMRLANPTMTNRAIANRLGCNKSTVSNALRYRAEFKQRPGVKSVMVGGVSTNSGVTMQYAVSLPKAPWE